ncbi:MAG: cation:proton antiporter [Polyangiales bacterium]
MTAELPPGRNLRRAFAYAAMISGTVAAFLVICRLGEAHSATVTAPVHALAQSHGIGVLGKLLVALLVVIVASQLLGALFKRIGSPPVIGEIVAGILLGPSAFGQLAPELSASLFTPTIMPGLSILSQVGVILYMFLIGLEVDLRQLARRGHAAVAISHASIVAPFLLGAGLSFVLHPRFAGEGVSFTHFALFSGVSMSVTAFPVLARILSDRGEQTSRLGALALSCAAVDDVTAWCLLALVVSVIGGTASDSLWTLALTVAFIAGLWALRPLIERLVGGHDLRGGQIDKAVIGVLTLAVLGAALTTELIGIHALFGAFAVGVLVPAGSQLAERTTRALSDFVVVLFLPAFFAFTGLRTRIDLVSGGYEWLICALVLATACVGKFGGTLGAARLTGMSWRDSARLGIMMNTRGLMELIVLNIGLDLKVISPTLFAIMVIMAVLTTFATTPVLQLLNRHARQPLRGELTC